MSRRDFGLSAGGSGIRTLGPVRETALFETARSTTSAIPLPRQRTVKFQLRVICGGQLKRRDLFFMAPSPGFHQRVVAIRGGPSIPARARSLAPERASGKTEDGTRRRSRSGALDLPCAPHADVRDRPPGGASAWLWRMAPTIKRPKGSLRGQLVHYMF